MTDFVFFPFSSLLTRPACRHRSASWRMVSAGCGSDTSVVRLSITVDLTSASTFSPLEKIICMIRRQWPWTATLLVVEGYIWRTLAGVITEVAAVAVTSSSIAQRLT